MPPSDVPEPWASFLSNLDAELSEETQLSCVGGFAMTVQCGFRRPTSDIDVLSIAPLHQSRMVLEIAGAGSRLHRKYGIYIQVMGGVVTLPENSDERKEDLFPGHYKNLRLFGLNPYDLALSKLERNSQLDRDDVKYLFRTAKLETDVLDRRYREEQRPYLSNAARHDLTLKLWREMLREQKQQLPEDPSESSPE
jgi:hypothetical protein